MVYRAALILITLFWITMNVLLWRAEYGGRLAPGTPVPADLVWQKMLTAPDSSSLSIFHHGKKIGFCHWITTVGEELSKVKEEDAPPEGMLGQITGYRIHVEGNVAVNEAANRARFDANLALGKERDWQQLHVRVNLRPVIWEAHADAAAGSVTLSAEENKVRYQRVFKLADLQNPDALMRELLGPMTYSLLSGAGFGFGAGLPKGGSLRLGLKWQARHHTVTIAHSAVRTYRVETRLLDRYDVVLIVSRVGEILRIELPNELVLVNDQLAGF